jgi:hypothetical protein
MVAATAMFPHFFTDSLKRLRDKKVPMIVSKMTVIISSEAFGMQRMWKWRIKRGVRAALPPPGGAAAQMIR